jgi:uncharacterized membrane protein (UPF0127 family)
MNVFVNDNMFKVKVCVTPDTIQKGMMGQNFNSDFNGMLFMLGNNEEQSFWMKNCIIPLDIIFINDDMTIQNIQKNCPPCSSNDCEHYSGHGKYVLELAGGTCNECGISEGQKIKISY